MSKQNSRESRRQRIEQARQAEQRRKRRIRVAAIGGGAVIAAAAIAVGVTLAVSGGSSSTPAGYEPLSTLGALQPAPAAGPLGPEAVPVPNAPALASTATAATGSPVDGISCDTSEQTLFHIHAHLTIFVNGAARQIPASIGIPGGVPQQTQAGPFIGSGTCFYWLHTHAADGIVHIESPVQRTYTLGQFFNEWGQPLGPDVVGPAHGHVTVLVNGKVFTGNPQDVPLTKHAEIQLEVGTPLVAPESISWANTGL
ncbi:MAG TPA: hypothetical protein VNH17_12740 [Streptosporangiaceae bacterium]|nr:hypothetical protein [Streptosporangiaceae bacterium]